MVEINQTKNATNFVVVCRHRKCRTLYEPILEGDPHMLVDRRGAIEDGRAWLVLVQASNSNTSMCWHKSRKTLSPRVSWGSGERCWSVVGGSGSGNEICASELWVLLCRKNSRRLFAANIERVHACLVHANGHPRDLKAREIYMMSKTRRSDENETRNEYRCVGTTGVHLACVF